MSDRVSHGGPTLTQPEVLSVLLLGVKRMGYNIERSLARGSRETA
jgi:hypothetical protein